MASVGMNPSIAMANRNKYRKFGVVRGDQYGSSIARDVELEAWLDREMQHVHARMRDDRGVAPSEGFAAIARTEQHPWRVEGRRLLEAVLADVDDARLNDFPFVWVRFIQRCRDLKRRGLLRITVVNRGDDPAGESAAPAWLDETLPDFQPKRAA
jgi:hypothetical protein